ncbi:putative F-box/FBD/LRR-repeat protein At1g78760 [Nicotiana tomentosiformis]|uniref:putative F-box/FBD/LRR-repeat protein At1g78760 n=1 Tax=Nicotiana tomentosiformis TaxID=4098 RepID=UPI00388CE81C
MEAKSISGEDRISELPVQIIYQILYQTEITPKKAAQTCVLSKRWYNFWISRPNLVLNRERKSWENFVNFVDQSLRPHVEKHLCLEQFSIKCEYHHKKLASAIDRWIDLVVKLNVKVLELHPWNSDTYYYSLPDAIYAARELKTLTLERCKFEFDISTTKIITFCNLKILDLRSAHILEDQLQRLLARCPFIRTLQLVNCQGINKLHVFGLVHLENLVVVLGVLDSLKSLIVQAPNLRYFGCGGMAQLSKGSEDNLVPCNIAIVDAYNTFEALKLWDVITEKLFQDMFSKHSNIFELDLESCYELKNIEIVSEKLKKLTLSKSRNLEQVKIQAPNLTEFVSEGDKIPFDLPHFVQKSNYSKGLILAIFCEKTETIFIYEDPKEIVVPPFDKVRILFRPVKHLESFIHDLMTMYPKTMSILSITNSKLLQIIQKICAGKSGIRLLKHKVLPTLIGCPDDAKTKRSYWQRRLKEVSTYTIEKEMDALRYSWLKSTPLFDQVTTFMFKW